MGPPSTLAQAGGAHEAGRNHVARLLLTALHGPCLKGLFLTDLLTAKTASKNLGVTDPSPLAGN